MWEERVETLSKQLVERLQPFVEARNPGVNNDSGTSAFRARMRKEAEELRMENLGPQVYLPFTRFESSLKSIFP